MRQFKKLIPIVLTVVALTPRIASAEHDRFSRDPDYQGKPLPEWIRVVEARDEQRLGDAFHAMRYFGADGRSAVPALTAIVTAPFVPIRVGKDSDEVILSKLYDIELRGEAMDALASMREAAASATMPLINWAVTVRVVPSKIRTAADHERLIDLVTMDAEQRIQAIFAIAEFGEAAVPVLTDVLKSPAVEKRRLAVAALGAEALMMAGDLLKSPDCDDARLGITILTDMEAIVAGPYLTYLRNKAADVCHPAESQSVLERRPQ
jgi:hypothetical protein